MMVARVSCGLTRPVRVCHRTHLISIVLSFLCHGTADILVRESYAPPLQQQNGVSWRNANITYMWCERPKCACSTLCVVVAHVTSE